MNKISIKFSAALTLTILICMFFVQSSPLIVQAASDLTIELTFQEGQGEEAENYPVKDASAMQLSTAEDMSKKVEGTWTLSNGTLIFATDAFTGQYGPKTFYYFYDDGSVYAEGTLDYYLGFNHTIADTITVTEYEAGKLTFTDTKGNVLTDGKLMFYSSTGTALQDEPVNLSTITEIPVNAGIGDTVKYVYTKDGYKDTTGTVTLSKEAQTIQLTLKACVYPMTVNSATATCTFGDTLKLSDYITLASDYTGTLSYSFSDADYADVTRAKANTLGTVFCKETETGKLTITAPATSKYDAQTVTLTITCNPKNLGTISYEDFTWTGTEKQEDGTTEFVLTGTLSDSLVVSGYPLVIKVKADTSSAEPGTYEDCEVKEWVDQGDENYTYIYATEINVCNTCGEEVTSETLKQHVMNGCCGAYHGESRQYVPTLTITKVVKHTWDAGQITKEPTATEEGVKTYTCTTCGATYTEAIAKKTSESGNADPAGPSGNPSGSGDSGNNENTDPSGGSTEGNNASSGGSTEGNNASSGGSTEGSNASSGGSTETGTASAGTVDYEAADRRALQDRMDCLFLTLEDGKSYWYENGYRQGTYSDTKGVMGDGSIRGREIYDPATYAWYWLDSCYNGAKAIDKEVWIPYIYQDELNWGEEEIRQNAQASGSMAEQIYAAIIAHKNGETSGKWVRYDSDGRMIKGWYTVEPGTKKAELYPGQVGNTYYYDQMTGLMAKGWVTIEGTLHHFDETTGALIQ